MPPWERQYLSNIIKTAHYTPYSIVPVAFVLQFTKLANAYWGLTACMQFYDPISTANPGVILAFLLFVVFVGVFKEWWADTKR